MWLRLLRLPVRLRGFVFLVLVLASLLLFLMASRKKGELRSDVTTPDLQGTAFLTATGPSELEADADREESLATSILTTVYSVLHANYTNTREETHNFLHNRESKVVGLVAAEDKQSSEEERVLLNMETCLTATNMSTHFRTMGYDVTARENVKHFLSVIRTVVPRDFSSRYTSPCWDAQLKVSLAAGQVRSRLGNQTFVAAANEYTPPAMSILESFHSVGFSASTVCLPKVFIAGFPKCGSTFLYCILSQMVGVEAQAEKEPHWWITRGPKENPRKPAPRHVPQYLFNFGKASHFLKNSNTFLVTIDASPNLMFDWPRFYSDEPPVNYCLLPPLIPQVLPDSKFVVIMRNPVDMVYSAFWFSCTTLGVKLSNEIKQKGRDIFHERIVTKINVFNQCLQNYSLEKCVTDIGYNLFSPELPLCGRTRLEMGMYYVHVHKWLSVVPREKFLFLTLEEVARDLEAVVQKLQQFLDIPESRVQREQYRSCTVRKNTQGIVDYRHDPHLQMRGDTKELLDKFFQPFNQKLAELTGNGLWRDEYS